MGEPPDLPDVSFFPVTAPAPDGTGDPLQFAATTAEELALLAAWVTGMAEWEATVKGCPFVQYTLPDIRTAMTGSTLKVR